MRSRSGCPTGRPIMRLLNCLRGRLWRFVCAVLASPASGAAATTGCHPESSESQNASAFVKGRPSGRPLHFWPSGVMGEKSALASGTSAWRQISNLNVHSESVWGAHEARPSCVGSCRMTLRVLFASVRGAASPRFGRAGADPGEYACRDDLPRAVSRSGEPARLPDLPRAACPNPCESPSAATVRADAQPDESTAPTQGLVSPFMPQAATPPTAGADSAPGASPSAAAPVPSAQAAAPPKPKKVAPPAPPRETALSDDPAQRFSPTLSSPPPRRPSAIRRSSTPAAGRPTSPRSAPARRARRW